MDQPTKYKTISVGDFDGDGRDDVMGRSHFGIDARSYNGTGWGEPLAPVDGFTDAEQWDGADNALTVQPADVLPAAGTEVIGRAGGGVVTYAIQDHVWKQQPGVVTQFSDANKWGTYLPVEAPDGSVPPKVPPGDVRYSTIKPVSVTDGKPQVVIGRDATGVRTFNADGSSPSAPFAPYTDPAAAGTPQGRAWKNINDVASQNNWGTSATILEKFSDLNQASAGVWKTMSSDLINASSRFADPDHDPVPESPFDPGEAPVAMNLHRDEYDKILEDVSGWTNSVSIVYADLLSATGKKNLIEETFVKNVNAVADIKAGFDANSALWALLGDLIWGLIGAGVIFTGGASTGVAAAVAAALSIMGSAAGAGIGFYDPNGAVNAEADELEAKLTNALCSAGVFIDNSFDQIVKNYGLLTAYWRMVEETPVTGEDLNTMSASMVDGQKLWIWQQFGNKNSGSNLWIGWCDYGAAVGNPSYSCPWDKDGPYTWAAPENPNIVYQLVGEYVGSQGLFANCNYSVFGNDSNAGLRDLYFSTSSGTTNPVPIRSPLSFISPRQTDTGPTNTGKPFNADNALRNNIGVLGWRLGTERCDNA